MTTIWKMALATALCAAACSQLALAQMAPATILKIDYENGVQYVYDSVDIPAYATVPTPISQVRRTFTTYVLLADVMAVNGKPAKGIFLTRQAVVNLTPTPSAGQAIADVTRMNFLDRIVEIQQPDGTPIGTITTSGFDAGSPSPGAPAGATGGNFAVTGGTGAFLGVRGQAGGGGMIVANRTASVREDPALRRVNGGGRGSLVAHLIPMSQPQIVVTPAGPMVFHADFSPVTAANPATGGEVLITMANGLGPTRPGVAPGQPFPPYPANPLQLINSPVEATVNGQSTAVINTVGWPGLVDTYRVDVRVPDGITTGLAAIQLTVAWIVGPSVSIPIQ
jgi:uncharacterized protein (TIGR03437 family)